MQETLMLRMSGGPTAPARARTALRSLDRTLGDLGNDADLLVSELVTNSVMHARAREVEVRAAADDERVRIEVSDPGPGFDRHVAQREPSPTGEGGYGLNIVDSLAHRWGVSRDGRSRVWLEIDRRRPREARFSRSTIGRDGLRELARG
jgi:anti-sigma regulatory factor (Ser/Thr protein kinase)